MMTREDVAHADQIVAAISPLLPANQPQVAMLALIMLLRDPVRGGDDATAQRAYNAMLYGSANALVTLGVCKHGPDGELLALDDVQVWARRGQDGELVAVRGPDGEWLSVERKREGTPPASP